MLTDSLNVALLPLDISWNDVDENIVSVDSALRRLRPGTDLVVLPELFTTGFIADRQTMEQSAEEIDGIAMRAAKLWAERYNVAIAGSYLAKTGLRYFNRGFFVEPGGDQTFYDKRHLFSLSTESELLTRGETLPPVVRFRGWNLSMVVCYDLRFPVWCRNTDDRYDAMLVPANWPNVRRYAWEHLLIARAIENQAYYLGANRSGADDYGEYADSTLVYDATGKPVVKSTDGAESPFVYVELHREELDKIREKLPFAAASDRFRISING